MATKFARFPLPFKVGIDICQIRRIKDILLATNDAGAERFMKRILTEEERELASEALSPLMKELAYPEFLNTPERARSRQIIANKVAPFIASRFAAKEAVIKASDDKLTFHDILILKTKGGQKHNAPYAVIKAGPGRSEDREALLSISHDGDYATAVCIAANKEAWPSPRSS